MGQVAGWIHRHIILPIVIALIACIITGVIVVVLGKGLLHFWNSTIQRPDYERNELWVALGCVIFIMVVAAILANAPHGALGPLDREVAIGHKPIFAPPPPPAEVRLRSGVQGTVQDIQTGDILYARSGALAKVIGILPGTEEHGRRYNGYIYAQGLYGASDELWIPFEAVMSVYPETHAIFLGIKGDETETFGWNKPPANISRAPSKEQNL